MVSWFVSLLVVAVTSCQPVLPLYCNAALEIYNYFKQSSSDLCTLNILLHYMQHNNKMINMKKLVSATSVYLYLYFSNLYLYVNKGWPSPQIWMFFWKRSEEGGRVISDPKNYIADFVGFKAVYFGRKFWKKCPKRGGGGGGHLQSIKFYCRFTQVNVNLREKNTM